MTWRRKTRAVYAGVLCFGILTALLWRSLAHAQPKQLPTIRFIIPNVEQTMAAATGTPARPTPSPAAADYWWNQSEYIEAFEFTPEQRKRMDAAMAHTQESTEQAIHEQNRARDRFHEAVKQRDWAAARKATEEWERAFAKQWSAGNQAKIAVLEVLTPAQHEKLLKDHSYLLDRPWTLGRRFQIQRGTTGAPTPQGTSSPHSSSTQQK